MKTNQPNTKKPKQKRRITLIEVLVVIALLSIVGRFIYLLWNWESAVKDFKDLGVAGSIAVVIGVIAFRKWIDSL